MYRDTPKMYACDAHCRALVKRGLRMGVSARLRPVERVFLCLVLTHSEILDDQHLCMQEWGPGYGRAQAGRSAQRIPRDI
jgi:uncharacterized protein (DUF924 family)